MRFVLAGAFVALVLAPSAAFGDDRVSPVLSTTMQRACRAESSQTVLFDASGRSRLNEPQVQRSIRTFFATAAGAGYAFEQGAITDLGDIKLNVDVAPNGVISNAVISGAALAAQIAGSPTPVDLPALAHSLASEIPERLIVGRSFALGDDYYPQDIRQTLISQMMAALGLPFPVSGSIEMPFRGEIQQDGRRAYLFEGTLRLAGEGDIGGRTLSIDALSQYRVVHDAATGLVLSYGIDQVTEARINGEVFTRQRGIDGYVCEIAPQ